MRRVCEKGVRVSIVGVKVFFFFFGWGWEKKAVEESLMRKGKEE